MIDVSKASLPKAIFLMGPTASGKTALAIELRKVLPVELISVDSALIYRGMDIGTAKPDAEELRAAPHRLLDILDPAQAYSAADFRRDALAEMAEITAAGRIPLLVGGTMLYFKALLEGLSPLPSADPDNARQEIEDVIGIDATEAVLASAKTGLGVEDILEAVVARVPPPKGDPEAPLKALIIDSWFDNYVGVVMLVRVVDGVMRPKDKLYFMATEAQQLCEQVGVFSPKSVQRSELRAGEVGFVISGIKELKAAKVGDTITTVDRKAAEPLPGFKEIKPQVFAGLYPVESNQYDSLRESLEKLKLKRGSELSDYVLDKNKRLIQKYWADKGFRNAEVDVRIDNDTLRQLTTRYSELSRLQRQPGPSFSLVSQALERVPAIKLESIEWKNQAPYAPGQKDENREVTIVRGAITLSQSEPRKVLGLFDNFVEALHGQPGMSITVQQRPFDIEPGSALRGGDGTDEAAQPRQFTVEIVRKHTP